MLMRTFLNVQRLSVAFALLLFVACSEPVSPFEDDPNLRPPQQEQPDDDKKDDGQNPGGDEQNPGNDTDEVKPGEELGKLQDDELNFTADDGNGAAPAAVTLNFTARTPWAAVLSEANAAWITVSPMSGDAGEVAMTITVQPNETTEERSVTLTVSAGTMDVRIVVKQAGAEDPGEIEPDPTVPDLRAGWPEIPLCVENENYTYVTHNCTIGGQTVRNFSLCFDKTKRGAWWVAYPLHECYLGSTGRTDAWDFDHAIPSSWQADLTKSYAAVGGVDYDRGHQIPSGDRTASREMNKATFLYSNMTPQVGQKLNQGPWGTLENKVREWICSDTLYVVTGAYWNEGSTKTTTDAAGNECPIPDYYFKVVVRTVKGNVRKTGDLLQDYKAGDLQAIGFWAPNTTTPGTYTNWVKSVGEIEQLTGFTFFPTIADEVKQQKNLSAW